MLLLAAVPLVGFLASCTSSTEASMDGPAITQASGNLFDQGSTTPVCPEGECSETGTKPTGAPQSPRPQSWTGGTLVNGYLCKVESYPFGLEQKMSLLAWYQVQSTASAPVVAVLAQAGNEVADSSAPGTRLWVAARVVRTVRYQNAAGDIHEAALLKLVTARKVGSQCS